MIHIDVLIWGFVVLIDYFEHPEMANCSKNENEVAHLQDIKTIPFNVCSKG